MLSDQQHEEVLGLNLVMVEDVRGWWEVLMDYFQAWHTGNVCQCISTSSFTKLQSCPDMATSH